MKKKILSLALAAVLALSLLPAARADYQPLSVSDKCAEFLLSQEDFSAKAYTDGSSWYIGYGTLCAQGDYPDGITVEAAQQLLRDKLAAVEAPMNSFLQQYGAVLTQSQFDALACMCYSFGTSFLNTGYRLPLYISKGISGYTDVQIVNAFAAWCHVNGKISLPLLERRIAEARMFINGSYSADISDWRYLILDYAGGKGESDVACFKYGQSYGTLPTGTRDGYHLTGWKTASGAALAADDVALENQTVTAQWLEKGTYTDVSADAWYYTYVHDLSAAGVIDGFEDGSFRPAQSVTYGQALKLILLAAGYKEQAAVDNGHWASGYLKFAVTNKFVDDGAITDLDAAISRNEIADLTAKALGLSSDGVQNPFADSSRDSVVALYGAGIVEGSVENGRRLYKGGSAITRAEISAILCRVQKYVAENIILFYDHRLNVNHNLAANPYDSSKFTVENGRVRYNDPNYDVQYGIDVSFYQGDIDWQKVAADGIDFAIIRVGYRTSKDGTLNTDTKFREYIEGAEAAGLDVGLYFFSQATNADEAVEEANYLIDLAKDYKITYPVAFDWEPVSGANSRSMNFDYSKLTDCAVAFCNTISAAGYTPAVYYNESFAYLRYDVSRLMGSNVVWLAHYTTKTDYRYDFQIWQYTSSGSVSGIAGRVDMDIAFRNFAN